MKRQMLFLALGMLLSACSWWTQDDDQYSAFKGMTAKQLYVEAKDLVKAEQYVSASKRLEALESIYPFSTYAEPAERLLIYVYYKNSSYPAAAAEAEHYIHLYPSTKQVDYAYYMKGLANFQQPRGALSQMLPIDEAWRDPGTQQQAYTDFLTFIQKFPHSRYYANALQRLIYLRNAFARRELHNATFAFEREMYVAAAGRATYLIQTYPQAPTVEPALKILYRAYMHLGLTAAAHETAQVYEATYHHSILNAPTLGRAVAKRQSQEPH